MRKFKGVVLTLVVIMCFGLLSGCNILKKTDDNVETEKEEEEEKEEVSEEKEEEVSEEKEEEVSEEKEEEVSEEKEVEKVEPAITDGKDSGIVKLIASTKVDIRDIVSNGVSYRDNNYMYGVMSLDGMQGTGAIYTYCESEGDYFVVSTTATGEESTDVKAMNAFGMIDGNGNEIIPMKYAVVNKIGDSEFSRYYKVCEVTEETKNEEDAVVGIKALLSTDYDTYYKGNWYIYDAVTGKKIEGAKGTKGTISHCRGDILEYYTDDGKKMIVNHKGEMIPDGAKIFDNGYYAIVKDNVGNVCDAEGTVMFNYDIAGYVPDYFKDNYFRASKTENGNTKYGLMDMSGNIIVSEFDDSFSVYGNFILTGDYKLYDLDGKVVVDDVIKYVNRDYQMQKTWVLENVEGTEWTVINDDGKVLYTGKEKKDNFTKVSTANGLNNLVDSFSNKVILENYTDYSYKKVNGFVCVVAKKREGGCDIYKVK